MSKFKFKKLTHKQIRELANEEKKASKMYAELGFWRFSRDEKRHAGFFAKLLKRVKK